MADKKIILGKDVTSINWVNGGSSYKVEELYLDGQLVWPDANWASSITVKGYRYRSSAAYSSMLSYLPHDFNNSGWQGSGEPWPYDSDYTGDSSMKTASGVRTGGLKCFYYKAADPASGTIVTSSTPLEIQTAMDSSSRWKITGQTVPSHHVPFTYGSVKGRKSPTANTSLGTKEDSVWGAVNEGVNGTYLPVFYRSRSGDSITTKEEARSGFIYSTRTSRVYNKRPRSGYYFTSKKATGNDFFTGIYTNTKSAGRYIIIGVHYPSFSEAGLGGGENFRFELRTQLADSEYKFREGGSIVTEMKSSSKRKSFWGDNVYYENTLSHEGKYSQVVKTVNIGRFSAPVLWTTDSFPDAANDFYGPIDSGMTWDLPIDQLPHFNESIKWKPEGGSWSTYSIPKTYWNMGWDILNDPASPFSQLKAQSGFETSDLSITAIQ
jgi:hypothetical protein